MEMIPMYIYTAFFFGAIPLLFMIISAIFVLCWHRIHLPVVVALALYQAVCIMVLRANIVPGLLALCTLAIVWPVVLALAGSIWTVVATKALRERVYGIGISTVGCALTGFQVAFYIIAIWGTI